MNQSSTEEKMREDWLECIKKFKKDVKRYAQGIFESVNVKVFICRRNRHLSYMFSKHTPSRIVPPLYWRYEHLGDEDIIADDNNEKKEVIKFFSHELFGEGFLASEFKPEDYINVIKVEDYFRNIHDYNDQLKEVIRWFNQNIPLRFKQDEEEIKARKEIENYITGVEFLQDVPEENWQKWKNLIRSIEKKYVFRPEHIKNGITFMYAICIGAYYTTDVFVTIENINIVNEIKNAIDEAKKNKEKKQNAVSIIRLQGSKEILIKILLLGAEIQKRSILLLEDLYKIFFKYFITKSSKEEIIKRGLSLILCVPEDMIEIKKITNGKKNDRQRGTIKIKHKDLQVRLPYPVSVDNDFKYKEFTKVSVKECLVELDEYYENIFKKQKKNLIRIAIISILIDSFAHSIAAHALSVIIEWLRRRVELLKREYYINNLNLNLEEILSQLESVSNNLKANKIDTGSIEKAIQYLDNTLYSLRQINCFIPAGLLNCLAREINNSEIEEDIHWKNEKFNLLGIIKYGKDILLKIITFTSAQNAHSLKDEPLLLPVPLDDTMYNFLKYLENKSTFWSGIVRETVLGGQILNWYDLFIEFANNPLFIGTIAATEDIYKIEFYMKIGCAQKHFLTVDVSGIKEEKEKMGQIDYAFVKKGSNFDEIKTHLSEMEVFLPGGEVGKQSLYTIFENVLRNIKWCEKEIEGKKRIKFVIEIEDKGSSCKTYNVNVWLENKTNLFENGKRIIDDINEKLKKSIIDDTGRPRLGGLYQNKVCACQLFTNVFDEVETLFLTVPEATESQRCYPWLRVKDNLNGASGDKGYISHFFRTWKGEKLGYFGKEISQGELNANGLLIQDGKVIDNIRRYKIVVAQDDNERKKIGGLGVVRVVLKDNNIEKSNNDKFEKYYKKWLDGWLKEEKENKENILVKIKQDGSSILCVEKNWQGFNNSCEDTSAKIELDLIHAERKKEKLIYRNHGILIKELLSARDNITVMEISETLLTKVVIIDDRINLLLERYKKETREDGELWDKLRIKVEGEKKDLDELKNELQSDLVHFLVIHLGYLEKRGFKEDEINKFIETHISFENSSNEKLKCKKLVISTGRGRSDWYNKLIKDKNHKEKILFVPPNAIEATISRGLSIQDDFEIKYGLIKLLMQS